jgi:RecJ-like exonuclease
MRHASPFMRLGACLAFNGFYRKFREDSQLVRGMGSLLGSASSWKELVTALISLEEQSIYFFPELVSDLCVYLPCR